MDYEGQRLAELLFQWIICSFGAVGWVIGYINQDFYHTFYVWLAAVVISVIVSNLRIRKLSILLPRDNYLTFSNISARFSTLDMRSRLAILQSTPCKVA